MIDPGLLFLETAVTRHHMTNTIKSIPTSRKNSTSFFVLFCFVFIVMKKINKFPMEQNYELAYPD
jgi:hypothetical protein